MILICRNEHNLISLYTKCYSFRYCRCSWRQWGCVIIPTEVGEFVSESGGWLTSGLLSAKINIHNIRQLGEINNNIQDMCRWHPLLPILLSRLRFFLLLRFSFRHSNFLSWLFFSNQDHVTLCLNESSKHGLLLYFQTIWKEFF